LEPSVLFNLVPLIILFPVVGLLANIIVGRRMGEKGVGWLATSMAGAAFVVSVLLAVGLGGDPEGATVPLGPWIHIGDLQLDWAFRVDTLSVTMMLVVSGVGTLIHMYAIGYMHEDVRHKNDPARFGRFFVYLNLFIAMMMILVSGASYLVLFVGWEGVGLCSFLLIGFWYEMDMLGRPSWANSNAAKKAFVANRVGDFGFILAIFVMFWAFKSLNFETVFSQAPAMAQAAPGVILAITLLMLIGVAGKSAQIPLYVWLPDAMAGPTPVSALIHAATMVTAGVYLIVRSAPLYSQVYDAQYVVATLGAATALFAATIALGQYDIKKVLAYSTISQLGFMVAAAGMGGYVAGMFHLITHAFFKALLFLSAGSVLLGMERGHHHLAHHGEQEGGQGELFDPGDMRNMGGLRRQMPTTFSVYLIGALALAGIFPLSGFWSKDEILLEAARTFPWVFWMLLVAAFFTAFYMTRQIWLVFFGEPRTAVAEHAEESPRIVTVPLMVLAFLSTVGGALNLPYSQALEHWLEHTLGEHAATAEASSGLLAASLGGLNPWIAILATLVSLVAIYLGWLIYGRRPLATGQPDPLRRLGALFAGMEHKWFIDEAYKFLFINPYVRFSHFLADKLDGAFWHDWFHERVIAGGFNWFSHTLLNQRVDAGFIDGLVVNRGLGEGTKRLSASLRGWNNGFVRYYALTVVIGVVLILGYLLLR
jgi:NADH-quinone oxidoreductase subunit L